MKNNYGLLFIIAAVVAIGASLVYAQYASKQADEGVVLTTHTKGNSAASVTLVEYSDFQCPACAQFQPVVKEIMEQYGDKLRFEYKHFPLISIHPNAVPAAKAAEAAGQQGKFFEMHDLLFENQNTWAQSSNPNAFFLTYAEDLGLDVELFKQHLKSGMIEDSINESFMAARERGLTGTPSFFLNDQPMQFSTFDEFRGQIEAALGIETATTTPETTVPVEFGI